MNKGFLDDYLLYQFVSAAHAAQAVENETGIEMSWADFDSEGELESVLPNFSLKAEKKFEKQLKKAVNDPEIESLFAQMEGVEEEELEELQACIMEEAEDYLRDFMK
ncbi:MAG: hypothetical protein K2O18_12355 [Oscillospiraceae bacterium]|nr:hypothetical protein [Oscillospiraceae bacterium]